MDEINVGDLVETCSFIPGFVVWVNPKDPHDIEVMSFNKLEQYTPGHGSGHHVEHCGVHKISTKRAMLLCALGSKKLKELWEDTNFDYMSDDALEGEFLKLREHNDH